MPPVNPENQPVNASLPPLQSMPTQTTTSQPQPLQALTVATPPQLDIVSRIKLVISQNAKDPYRLNAALQQLKSEHLAAKFNTAPKTGQH